MSRVFKNSGVPWLKDVPMDWKVERGKNVLVLQKRPVRDNDEVVTCFRDGEVILRSLRRTEGFTMSDKEIGYQGINEGDIVIHGMDGFAGAMGVSKSTGKGSPVLVVCTPKYDCVPQYIIYYLRALAMTDVFVALATGIRERSCDLRWNKISELEFIIPTAIEQQKIASYLDEKCSEIDEMVVLQEKIIEELKAYKQSVITEAVTKGLNPDVPMKDSGIEWIGEIPESWEYDRLKHLFVLHRGYDLANEEFVNQGIPVYGSSGFMGYHNEIKVKAPNVIIGRSGSTGKLHYVEDDFWAHNTGIYISDSKGNIVKYLYYVLSSIDMDFLSTKTAVPTLDRKKIQEYSFVYTNDVEEQQSIASYLDEKCTEIDFLISIKQSKIESLKEYKKSIIYEYVTGKKEVMG